MTYYRWICFDRYAAMLVVALTALTAASMNESTAQIKQTLRVKVNATPAVRVSRMDAGAQRAFADEMPQLRQMLQEQSRGSDTTSFGFGLSISSFENVSVLLSFTVPELTGRNKRDSSPVRITCGYLNDGTTNFRRATFSDKSPIQFPLRNRSLLRRSMQSNNSQFFAYVFFLIDQRKGEERYEGPMPLAIVTVEIL